MKGLLILACYAVYCGCIYLYVYQRGTTGHPDEGLLYAGIPAGVISGTWIFSRVMRRLTRRDRNG